MAEVLIQGGQAYLRDPRTGMTVLVPQEQAREALAAGLTPATQEQYGQRQLEEKWGGPGGGALSFLAGAGRAATLGLSDLALTKSGLVAPETLSALRDVNPEASTVGEVGGALGSMFIPGGPVARLAGVAGKAGAATSAGVARALGSSAGNLLPRVAGAIASEGTFGAGLGVGQAITEVALSREEQGGLDILSKLAKGAGTGAAVGAGLGAIGSTVAHGARRVAARWGTNVAELRRLRGEQTAIGAEVEAMQASGASSQEMSRAHEQLLNLTVQVKEQQIAVAGQLFSRGLGMGIGAVLGGGVGGSALGYLIGPTVAKHLAKALRPLGGRVGDLSGRLSEKISPYLQKAGGLLERGALIAEGLAPGSVQRAATTAGEYIGEKGAAIGRKIAETVKPETHLGEAFFDVAGHAVGGALAMAPAGMAEGFMVGGVHGAVLSGAAYYAARELKESAIAKLSQALVQKAFPGAKKAVFDQLSNLQITDLSREVQRMDPAELEGTMRAQYPTNLPPAIGDAITQQLQRTVTWLQRSSPPIQDGKVIQAGDVEMNKLRARYEVILRPSRFMELFGEGRLTQEHVSAWQAVYPAALAQLRAVIKSEQARAQAQGLEHTRQQAHQIALVQGEGAGRLYDPQVVAMLQQSHSAAQAQPPTRTRPPKVARQHQTTMNRLAGEG